MTSLPLYRKTRKRRASPEAALQKAIVQHLLLNGAPGLLYFHVPNQGRRSAIYGHELKLMGMVPGCPDLILMHGGTFYGLEVKRLGETPTDAQIAFGQRMVDAGGDWAYADSIDDALAMLDRWNLLGRQAGRRAA